MTHPDPGTPSPSISPTLPARARIFLLVALFVAATFIVYRQASTLGARPGLGAKTDWTWAATDPDGNPVDLSQYRGKPVFLNVWATWCGPCVSELPSIARLAQHPKVVQAGVSVLCVSIDDDPSAVSRFLASQPEKLRGPLFLVASESPPPPFLTDAIPATFLISADGRIVESSLGADDWSLPDKVDRVAALAGLAGNSSQPKADAGP